MEGREIRRLFVDFFEARGHRRVASSSLIPNDPTLLLTTAGMVQFKPYLLGLAPPPFPRAVSVQKAFRTTDIENVGHTARHMTFFEMLGNFSFGDYFKSEACAWGWELVTEGYGLDPERIWATVYEDDDESIEIWTGEVGLPRERIVRRGREDNFWWLPAGPGGPCSEIFVDRGPRYGPEGGPAVDEERYLEIWNLVFMQHEVDEEGNTVGDLPKRSIDTGSGLERVAIVLQDVDSAYETDLLRPMVEAAESLSGRTYGKDERDDVSLRVIAEHGRATTFLIADGVQPDNTGRGYVLRRMLRRMLQHANRLGIDQVTERLVETTAETLGEAYPELVENRAFILKVAAGEEDRFKHTLRRGLEYLEDELPRSREAGRISGDFAFRLHDTHGVPLDLLTDLAIDEGLEVDADRFHALMREQQERAKAAAKRGDLTDDAVAAVAGRVGQTEFVGYERLEDDTEVVAVLSAGAEEEAAGEGQEVRLVLARTPFYAEGGGQIGDHGTISTSSGVVRVTDTQVAPGDVIVHQGVVESGEIRRGEAAHATVDAERRAATARSHTATHVVHWTLKHVLGEHARQAGSWVGPGRCASTSPTTRRSRASSSKRPSWSLTSTSRRTMR
jgi:alanyl-tRNA synthetase